MIKRLTVKKTLTLISTVAAAAILCGFLPPKHSQLKVEASNKLTKGKTTELLFKVVPNDNMLVTPEGPWKLTIKNHTGLELPSATYQDKKFDQSIPGFTVKTKVVGDKVSFDYEVKSFICTKDKKRCYPELHKGKFK